MNIESRKPDSTCCFCETRNPPCIVDMRVVFGSPRKNAMLPFSPPVKPVAGFDPIGGRDNQEAPLLPLLRGRAPPRVCRRDAGSRATEVADVERRGRRRLFLRAHGRGSRCGDQQPETDRTHDHRTRVYSRPRKVFGRPVS